MSDKPVITDAVLDQWEGSAEQDAERDQPWSTNPRAILAVIAELRERREEAIRHSRPQSRPVHLVVRTECHDVMAVHSSPAEAEADAELRQGTPPPGWQRYRVETWVPQADEPRLTELLAHRRQVAAGGGPVR